MAKREQPQIPRVARATWWVSTYALGYGGALLVIYSVIAAFTTPWYPVETFARLAADLLTVLGVAITAASIYFPFGPEQTPWRASRWVIAPIVITVCVTAAIVCLVSGPLPSVFVNGLALLGLSGALQRMVPINVEDVTNA